MMEFIPSNQQKISLHLAENWLVNLEIRPKTDTAESTRLAKLGLETTPTDNAAFHYEMELLTSFSNVKENFVNTLMFE
jgi:hypothetical protein